MRSALTCNGCFRIYEDGSISKITDSGETPAKTYLNQCGYKFISYNNHIVYVHRLVAAAFIENPGNRPAVNHIDGNKENNDASNLEWVTFQENTIHAYNTGLIQPMKNGSPCRYCGEVTMSENQICRSCQKKIRQVEGKERKREMQRKRFSCIDCNVLFDGQKRYVECAASGMLVGEIARKFGVSSQAVSESLLKAEKISRSC